MMKTYQVEIKETLCMTVEIEAENEQQAEEKVRQKNTSLIQNTLPVWNLPLKKKRWKNGLGSKNDMNMSDDGSYFSAGNLIPTVSIST